MLTNPTQEQKRIAIAKHCGWDKRDEAGWWGGYRWYLNGKAVECEAPHYFNDLDAMYETEEILDKDGVIEYQRRLVGITCNTHLVHKNNQPWAVGFLFHAKCEERAEAFGLTLKLWEYAPTEKEK